jgi:hypothetical protein
MLDWVTGCGWTPVPLASHRVVLAQSFNLLITWLVFLVTSSCPGLSQYYKFRYDQETHK